LLASPNQPQVDKVKEDPRILFFIELNIVSPKEVDMIFDKLELHDILKSMEAEAAKTIAELKCARKDLEQADARLRFLLSAVHYLKDKIGK
jgi:hypothetical protein